MPDANKAESLDAQANELRSSISDLAYQVDAHKTKTGAALGGGVFFAFLAALAAYDTFAGKGGVWVVLGLSRGGLVWIAATLGVAAALLLIIGISRTRQSGPGAKAELEALELEYAELLERRDALDSSRS